MSAAGFKRGEELLRVRSRDQSLMPSGEKLDEAVDSWLEDKMVESRLQEHHNLIQEPKVARKDQLTVGEWLPVSQMVKVDRPGKFWHYMGVETDIGKCLYPEEALYLIDTGELEVVYEGLPLSLQQAQALLLQDGHHLEQYFVYAHISRTGCKVVRHQTHLIYTKYEMDIRLDQHQMSKKSVKLKLGSDEAVSSAQKPAFDPALKELYASLGEAAANPLTLGKEESNSSSNVKSNTVTPSGKKEQENAAHSVKETLSAHEIRRRELIEMFPSMIGKDVFVVECESAELLPKNSVPSKDKYRISTEGLEYYSVYETRHHYHYQYNNHSRGTWKKEDAWNLARNERWNSNSGQSWRSRDDSFSSRNFWGHDDRWERNLRPQWDSRDSWRKERNDRWKEDRNDNWREDRSNRWSSSNDLRNQIDSTDTGYGEKRDGSRHNLGFGDNRDSPVQSQEGKDVDYSVWPEWKKKRRPFRRQQGRDGYPSALVRLRTRVTSWKEYKLELADRRAEKELSEGGTKVLWEGRTTPLTNPHIAPSLVTASSSSYSTSIPAAALLSSCSLNTEVTDTDMIGSAIPPEAQLQVVYDVYLPSVTYKKSNPPAPNKRVVVVRDGTMPSPGQILEVSSRFADDVAVVLAVVTGGEVRLYNFTSTTLPPPLPHTR